MKQLIILILVVMIRYSLYAQTDDWMWVRQAGGTSLTTGEGIVTDSIGNSYVTGAFDGTATFGTTTLESRGNTDIFIAKLDTNGNWLWVKQAGGTNSDYGYGDAIAIDCSGNCYVLGSFWGNATFGTTSLSNDGGYAIFIAKLDTNGNWLWASKAGSSTIIESGDVAIDSEGNCFVTGDFYDSVSFGTTNLSSSGVSDIFIAKLDTNGNWLWAKKAGGIGAEYAKGIALDSNVNCYLTGMFQDTATFGTTTLISSGTSDIIIAKLDANGNWLWVQQAGGADSEAGYSIASDSSGNCYLTGVFIGASILGSSTLISNGYTDIFIAKLDAYGNWIWARQAGGTSGDYVYSLAIDSEGNNYVTGFFGETASFGNIVLVSSNADLYLAKLDTNGNYIWVKQAGGASGVSGNDVSTDSFGNSYVTGRFLYSATFGNSILNSNGADFFITKISPAPILQINDTVINYNATYIGLSSYKDLWISNIGSEVLVVDSLCFNLADTQFDVMGLAFPIEIAVGDSIAMQIRFNPLIAGVVSDSLVIYNNSNNMPRAAIRLCGTGQNDQPRPPENVEIVMNGENVVLSWDAVTESVLHTPIVPDYYLIFYNGSNDIDGQYYYLGRSWTLSYLHDGVTLHAANMFYRVRAYKHYGRSQLDYAGLGLEIGRAHV